MNQMLLLYNVCKNISGTALTNLIRRAISILLKKCEIGSRGLSNKGSPNCRDVQVSTKKVQYTSLIACPSISEKDNYKWIRSGLKKTLTFSAISSFTNRCARGCGRIYKSISRNNDHNDRSFVASTKLDTSYKNEQVIVLIRCMHEWV